MKKKIMKSMLKNIIHIIRRFRTAAVLNIAGLSVAFAAFIIIMMQVGYDYNFDKFHEDHEQIYRLEGNNIADGENLAIVMRGLADYVIRQPQVKEGTLSLGAGMANGAFYFGKDKSNSQDNYRENITATYPNFLKFFHFEMVEGNLDALAEPHGAVIPESMAKKIFGEKSAIGQTLYNRDKTFFIENDYFTVRGVYKDFPKNSSVLNVIYGSLFSFPEEKQFFNDWGSSMFNAYIKVNDKKDLDAIESNVKDFIANSDFNDYIKKKEIRFTPLSELHFVNDLTFDYVPKTSYETVLVLLMIAIVIIIIASVNYTNFSIALIPLRIRSVNIRKVLGSSSGKIRYQFITEAVCICLLSYMLGVIIVILASKTPLITLIDADPDLLLHWDILVFTFLIAVLVGLLSGTYPAFYSTSHKPALVLKGSFGLSLKGRRLRSLLIGIQFIASFILIISASFIYLQNKYIRNMSLGYDKENLIVADINSTIAGEREVIREDLKKYSGIEDVSYSWALMSSADQYMDWGRDYKRELINFQVLVVDPSFLNVAGIKVMEGRDFRKSDENSKYGKYIFNEKAKQEYGLELNADVQGEIIGFISNIQYNTFYSAATPMAFYVVGTENWGFGAEKGGDFAAFTTQIYVKVKAGTDRYQIIENIKGTLEKFDPSWPFNVRFYDSVLQDVYEKDQNLSLLITVFSIVAILISIIGVFGLVIFENEYRRKEISIRKVLGSSIGQILALFSKTYLIILTLCFVISCPVVYYIISRWLENFTVHTPLHWWVFLAGGILIFSITIFTVNWQSWRGATANPVDALKNE